MSLEPRVPIIDLSPNVPDSLTPRKFSDYLLLWNWVLYHPHSLATFINANLIDTQQTSYLSSRDEGVKYWWRLPRDSRTSLLELTVISVFCVTFTLLLFCFGIDWLISQWFNATTLTLVDLVDGIKGLLIGSVVVMALCKVIIHNLAQRIAAQLLYGVTAGVMTSIYFMDGRLQLPFMSVMFIFWGVCIACGIYIGTLSCYQSPSYGLGLFLISMIAIAFCLLCIQIGVLRVEIVRVIGILMVGAIGFGLPALRPDDWLSNNLERRYLEPLARLSVLPHVTRIPVYKLAFDIEDCFDSEWDTGLQYCVEILRYTRQKRTVLHSVRQVISEKQENPESDDLVGLMEQLWQTFAYPVAQTSKIESTIVYPLPLLFQDVRIFIPPERKDKLRKWYEFLVPEIDPTAAIQLNLKSKLKLTRQQQRAAFRKNQISRVKFRRVLTEKIEVNSPASAAAGGLWYLEKMYPSEAAEAFGKAKFSKLGSEMAAISKGLSMLWESSHIPDKGTVSLPKKSKTVKHSDSWDDLMHFQEIVRYVWVLRRCKDPTKFALVAVMIVYALAKIHFRTSTKIEDEIIKAIARDWETEAYERFDTMDEYPRIEAVENPFVYTEPISSKTSAQFVERKNELSRLKAAWRVGNFQPTLIYGQRQSGKTSLLRAALSSDTKLVLIGLQQIAIRATVISVFQAICDGILAQNVYYTPVSSDLLQEPYRIFSQYIKEMCFDLGSTGVVIALDEFEFIEDHSNRLELRRMMSCLWSLSQAVPNLGVAFLTTSTLAEINAKFDNPFTRYMQPIEVGFLTEKGIAQLLRHPTPDFLPYCHALAVSEIFRQTAGQPYLVQLIATYLFDWYNQQVMNKNNPDPLLTDVDVITALSLDAFKLQSKRYYRGIYDEAMRIDAKYAIPILNMLAPYPNGLIYNNILRLKIQAERINFVLSFLEAHLIIEQYSADEHLPSSWRIKVPLFREWLINQ